MASDVVIIWEMECFHENKSLIVSFVFFNSSKLFPTFCPCGVFRTHIDRGLVV